MSAVFDFSDVDSWDDATVIQFLDTWTHTLDQHKNHPIHGKLVQLVDAMAQGIESGVVPVASGRTFIKSRLSDVREVLGMAEPPKPTGTVLDDIDLTGKLLAFEDGQPVMVTVIGGTENSFYLPLFDDLEAFATFLGHSSRTWDGFSKVEDPAEFLASLPPNVIVMVNPWFTEEGRVRWYEVKAPG